MNSKGQEFSVFKLLISAIIAVVILAILLSIIGLPDFFRTSPQAGANNLISQITKTPNHEEKSGDVTFQPNESFNSKSTANASGGAVTEEQVCVHLGQYEGRPNWESPNQRSVVYVGGSSVKTKLVGMCSRGNELQDDVMNYGTLIKEEWVDEASCPCASTSPENTQLCCIIAVVYSTS